MLQENLIITTLLLVQIANIIDFMIMMPLGPLLMRALSIGPGEFGALVSAYGVASGLAGFLLAPLIDRLDRRTYLKITIIGLGLATLVCGVVNKYEFLLFGRMIAGVFGGVMTSLSQAIVADVVPIERRGRAFSKIMISFSFAAVLGVPLGLTMANQFGWQSPFLLVSAFLLLVFLIVSLKFPVLRGHISNQLPLKLHIERTIDILRDPAAQTGLVVAFLIIGGQFLIIPYISAYLVGNLGLPEKLLPVVYLCGGLANIVSLPLLGILIDKFSAAKVFPYSLTLSVFPLILLTNTAISSAPVMILVTTLFMLSMGARMAPYTTLMTTVVGPERRAPFLSISLSCQSLAQGLSALVGSRIVHKGVGSTLIGYSTAGWLAVIATFLTLFCSRRILQRV